MSEFLHKDMYDENHKLRAFAVSELLKKNPRISRPSTGSYEGNLLCADCDNRIIGNYESYVSKLFKNRLKGDEKPKCRYSKSLDGIKAIDLSNLNYSSFKLFLLSLLWRAHISSRDEYSDVDLGPYAEKIRNQLLEGDPSTDDDLIISITKLDARANYSSFIGQPRRHKIGGSTTYSIIINGYIISYHLKANHLTKRISHLTLTAEGKITILEVPKEKVQPFVLRYIGMVN